MKDAALLLWPDALCTVDSGLKVSGELRAHSPLYFTNSPGCHCNPAILLPFIILTVKFVGYFPSPPPVPSRLLVIHPLT
uniref:Uncharacterized protein n=1 Tax=Anguilla anguilla TaxID=7936 RepID=A0A0E9WDI3_ANGAN